jgi:cytochrome c oxidase subunit 1
MLPFVYNVWKSRNNPKVGVDDPWGWGRSLEWATSCPPPRHNFTSIPRIRSESPAFDLHHPEVALSEYNDMEGELNDTLVDAADDAGRRGLLEERVSGDSSDPVEAYDDKHPNQSPLSGDFNDKEAGRG